MVWDTPVEGFATSISAPGIMAPDVSVTRPLIWPWVVWAGQIGVMTVAAASTARDDGCSLHVVLLYLEMPRLGEAVTVVPHPGVLK